MDIKDIRQGIKDTLEQIDGLNVDNLRDLIVPPAAIVVPAPPFDLDYSAGDLIPQQRPEFAVHVFVAYVDNDGAQDELDEYLSSTGIRSVKAVLEANNTLAGRVSDLHVKRLQNYGVTSIADGGVRYLSAEFAVEIYA
jgi:hypothetical protein